MTTTTTIKDRFVMYWVTRSEQENMTLWKNITEMSQKKFALLPDADVQASAPH